VDGWIGPNCDINPCAPNPCQNSGICSSTPSGSNAFTCNCVDGWSGTTCQNNVCNPNPCQNSGTCSTTPSGSNAFTCNCVNGWMGSTCQTSVCNPDPCLNNGTCSTTPSGSNAFTCTCADGFNGGICDSNSVCDPTCGVNQACIDQQCVSYGDLFFRINWYVVRDIDLTVVTPSGKIVYSNNIGPSLATDYGFLEDQSTQMGPENIYWSGTPPTGNYQVCVTDYAALHKAPAFTPVTITYGYLPNNIHTTTFTTQNYVDPSYCHLNSAQNYALTFSYP